jgi:hypothetical protein
LGVLAHWCGWSPEVDWGKLDWGNVPGWVTALTALAVGVFAIINVLIARKAYQRGKWIDEVATARLVWSIVTRSGTTEKGEPLPELKVDSRYMWNADATKAQDGVTRVNRRSVYVVVQVTNGSNEPVGDVEPRVHDAVGRLIVDVMNIYKVIRPGGTHTWLYVAPAPEDYIWSELHSSIRFHDSAGLAWRRSDTSPPERDEGRVASKAYEKAQAELWQRTQERCAEERAKRRAKRREARVARKATEESSEADRQEDGNL